MTKCHLIVLAGLLTVLSACKTQPQGPSLAEYGARTQATQEALFERFVHRMMAAPDQALRLQDSLLREAEADSTGWQRLIALEDKYLLDPNSPYRNEEWFIPVAQHMCTSPHANEQQRLHAQWLAPRLALNRPGTVAADFAFLTPNGRQHTLHATIDSRKPRPQRTLLFFSNPGCPNCKEITEALEHDLTVQAHIASGELLVVNIYPDEDVQAWLDYLPNYPKEWVCGYDDQQILNSDTRYWIRAIPSLYLLDEEKRVLRKDAPLEQILEVVLK